MKELNLKSPGYVARNVKLDPQKKLNKVHFQAVPNTPIAVTSDTGELAKANATKAKRVGKDLVLQVTHAEGEVELTLQGYFEACGPTGEGCAGIVLDQAPFGVTASVGTTEAMVSGSGATSFELTPLSYDPMPVVPSTSGMLSNMSMPNLLGAALAAGVAVSVSRKSSNESESTPTPPTDTTPTAPFAVTAISNDNGPSSTDFITNDNTLTFSGTSNAASNTLLSIRVDGAFVGFAMVSNGTWSYAHTTALSDGVHTVTAQALDSNGNLVGEIASQTLTIDTSAAGGTGLTAADPSSSVAIAVTAISNDNGPSSTDFITNDNTLTFNGTSNAVSGTQLAIRLDGTLIGYATVTGGGAWSYAYGTAITNGTHTVSAQAVDTAGNGIGTAASHSLIIDTSATGGTGLTPEDPSNSVAIAVTAISNDSGPSSTDFITNDTTLTFSGTTDAVANTQLAIKVDGIIVGYASVTSGTWSYAHATALTNGTHTITAQAVDTAGNLIGTAASHSVIIDNSGTGGTGLTAGDPASTVAVALTAISNDTGPSSTDFITNDNTLTFSGTSDAMTNTQLVIKVDGTVVGYATVTGGSWSYAYGSALNNGDHVISAQAVDTAGNLVGTASTRSVTIDTSSAGGAGLTAGDPSSSALMNITGISSDTGNSSTDFITNDTSLTFTGTSGAVNGTQLAITVDGVFVGYTTVTSGSWSYAHAPSLTEGAHTVTAQTVDTAGNLVGVVASHSLIIDTTAATPTLALLNDTGGSSTDHITNDPNLSIGNTEAGASLQYSTDGSTWTSSYTSQAGNNTVYVRQIDVAGNTSQAASLSYTFDTTNSPPTVNLTDDSGSSNTDLITNNDALTLGNTEVGATIEYSSDGSTWGSSYISQQGLNTVYVRQIYTSNTTSAATSLAYTLDQNADAPTAVLTHDNGSSNTDGITNNPALTLNGVEAGATVQYSSNGATWTSSYTNVNGVNTVYVRQIDAAGNTSASSSVSYTLDTSISTPTLALSNDTGGSSTDRITSNANLTVSGTEAGATVQYSSDGSAWGSSYTNVEGVNTVHVRQVDVAGNTSAETTLSYTLDTSAATVGLTLANDTGSSSTDHITSNPTMILSGNEAGATIQFSSNGSTWTNSHASVTGNGLNTIYVRQIDAAGNTSAASSISYTVDSTVATPTVALANDTGSSSTDHITNDATLALSGTEAGATIQYSSNNGATWASNYINVEGVNTVYVRQIDVAGNTSGASSLTFTLDVASTPALTLTSDTGSSGSDRITNNAALTVTGTEAGATIQYSSDGSTWSSSYTNVNGLNTAYVRQIDTVGNTSATSSLSYTFDSSASAPNLALTSDTGSSGSSGSDRITRTATLSVTSTETGATIQYSSNGSSWASSYTNVNGLNTVYVRQIDVAGNTSAASSLSYTFDSSIATPTVALTNDTGSSSTDGITTDTSLSLSGTETGATIQYSSNGSTWGSSYNPVNGINTVYVRQIDVAGNTSSTASLSYTLDSVSAPNVALTSDTGSSSSDHITNDASLTLSGTEVDATIQYSSNGSSWSSGYTTVNGLNTVYVRQIDVDGKTSAASSLSYTFDSTASAPTLALSSDTGSSSTDHVTSTASLTLSGTETGATIQYSSNGGSTWGSSYSGVEGANTVHVRQIDVAGNTSSMTSLTYVLDTAAPTLTITDDTAGTANGDITYTFTFSEAVTGFDASDIVLSAGVKGAFSGSGSVYTLVVTPPAGSGTLTVNVAAGAAVDSAGNASTAAVQSSQAYALPYTPLDLNDVSSNPLGFVINGQGAGDNSGMHVRSLGDVNGDGYADVIVGAPNAASAAGRSYVVFGKSTTTVVDLSTVALGTGGFVVNAQAANDNVSVVSGAGDVNGDGLADFIVGASQSDPAAGSDAGRSYVVFGRTATSALELSAIAAGIGGFVINGQAAGDDSGYGVSGAGDFNGDGLADLIISSPDHNSAAGRSYVVFGQTHTTAINLSAVAAGTGGFAIDGQSAGDASGNNVAYAGDVNGDGLSDVIVGAASAASNGGRSYVIFGHTGTSTIQLSDIAAGTSADGFVINAQSSGDALGISVSAAGDVNGDGLADLVVGAAFSVPAAGVDAGRTYVVFGKANQSAVDLSAVAAGVGGFVINGEAAGDYSGYSVASGGDINGDGLSDLIVGAFNANVSGRTYVVFGQTGTSAIDLSTVAAGTGGFMVEGQSPGDYSGISVSVAGDLDGDGLNDLIIGAPLSDPAAGTDAGRSYVLLSSQIMNSHFGTQLTQLGSTGADTLAGTAGTDHMAGGQGNDVLIGNGGADVMYGGAGHDVFLLSSNSISHLNDTGANPMRIDGGSGFDKVALDVSVNGQTLDLTTLNNQAFKGIEVFDITGGAGAGNTLTLNIRDLLTLPDEAAHAAQFGHTGDILNRLLVQGDSNDAVHLTTGPGIGTWSATNALPDEVINGITYKVYMNSTDEIDKLLVQSGMQVI